MQESSMLKKRLRVFESIYSEREKITTSTPKVNPFDFDLFSGEINSEFEHISPLKSLKISLSESPLSNVFRSLPLYIDKQEEMDSNVIVISLPYLISAEIVVQYLIIYGEVESLDTCHNKQNGTE